MFIFKFLMSKKDLNIKRFDAIVVAIRRYQHMMKHRVDTSEEINEILKNSILEIKSGINIYIIKNPTYFPFLMKELEHAYCHLIKGYNYFLIITDKNLRLPKTVQKHKNVIEIRIKSPENIEKVPGVVFLIYKKLYERGINIIETYSCWTDTILLIEKKDLAAVLEILNDELGVK